MTKIQRIKQKIKSSITEEEIRIFAYYAFGTVVGAASMYVGMTYHKDLLILTRSAQKNLMERPDLAIKYTIDKNREYFLISAKHPQL